MFKYVNGVRVKLTQDEIESKAAEYTVNFSERKDDKQLQLKEEFALRSIRPLVETSLGYTVQGGYQDIQDFSTAQALNLDFVIDAQNNTITDVTSENYDTIILEIRISGLTMKQHKWAIREAINTATTDEELEAIDVTSGW